MTNQEYLKEMLDTLKIFVNIRNEKMVQLDELFKSKGAKSEEDVNEILKKDLLTDDDLNKYHNTSMLSRDTNHLSQKICDFIYFNRIVGVELDLKDISDINGFAEFVKEYKPYQTAYVLTPENETREANPSQFNESRESFKKVIKNNNVLELINENRN